MTAPITLAYSPKYLDWTGSHASPQRAHLAVEHIKARAAVEGIDIRSITPRLDKKGARDALQTVHSAQYIDKVFAGQDTAHADTVLQGRTATIMFQGTRVLVEQIEADGFKSQVYFNPQGAKHHAMRSHSSGFCVFNDHAWAAHHFAEMGLKVAYLDWDAHHGDGVEALTKRSPQIMTASIHQHGIFPGTGNRSMQKYNALNYPLYAGDGDTELIEAMEDALYAIHDFEPDVLLVAAGADGYTADPLAQLEYTLDGFTEAAKLTGQFANDLGIPVLVGGAGGYTPLTYTPIIWSEVVHTIHRELTN